ncbi:hypothetical protein DOTSEDRAFT_57673 [Dothistroma septosporum NZE10]|uniref:Uncharacterized protein n=1 Tax=Dothistroma septosporum (strain NZE10 / CBS 128990) TaxID=675120 RepID=M2XZN6_DOTSN|nr:hypothetical protein DOTSEDRAFT_57673 [Dothistroma septosporum NZE10]
MSSSLRPLIPTITTSRSVSITQTRKASILFALGALSNSRETQHFNKLSRLDRVEHSPNLKLIKTSEIDPYPLPTPPLSTASLVRDGARTSSSVAVWDRKALQAGRAILSDNARRLSRMARTVERTKRREMKAKHTRQAELAAWAQERQKMRAEQRSAGVLILASVATATGLAMWRFWPQETARDSGEMGRRIAERARASIPLPAARSVGDVAGGTSLVEAVGVGALPVTGVSTPIVPEVTTITAEPTKSWGWSLKNTFWKVQ